MLVLDALPAFTFLAGILVEGLWRSRHYPTPPWWRTKCLLFSLAGSAVALGTGALLSTVLGGAHLVDGGRLGAAGVVAGLLAVTFCTYWMHRTYHRVDAMFRWVHQLHHSAERIDVFGANFGHPLQLVIQIVLNTLVLQVALGLPHVAAAITIALTSFMNTFQHLNIRTPAWIGYVLQRPESHNIHHQRGVHAWNYCDLPLWDLVFGTFRNPRAPIAAESGYYEFASRRIGAMLLGRDVTAPHER
jgi:sterol desaturase/sphingolipid hydroxylase (fatty acid hydroxylase superfamily)